MNITPAQYNAANKLGETTNLINNGENTMNIVATYSAEDNKIRLYASARLDAELYARVKDLGFSWAPKQELFAAHWSPKREDIAMELAGDIDPEETTLAERAAIKAARLDGHATKRAQESNSFSAAASRLSERFAAGQPILMGHHSQRKAEKDRDLAHSYMDKSVKAKSLADYWQYRANAVEAHANYKNQPSVIARRIKTLLADLRDSQRVVNHGHQTYKLWSAIAAIADAEKRAAQALKLAGVRLKTGGTLPEYGTYSKLAAGEISADEVIKTGMDWGYNVAHGKSRQRCIEHTLNRLAYERSNLGDVVKFDGDITPTMLQVFAREHGADSPKATKTAAGFLLSSPVPLPAHFADSNTLELPSDGWANFMQSCGYSVPDKKPANAPILNINQDVMTARALYTKDGVKLYSKIEITKEQYSKIHDDAKYIQKSICGKFRFRCCIDTSVSGPRYLAPMCYAFLTDVKAVEVPA